MTLSRVRGGILREIKSNAVDFMNDSCDCICCPYDEVIFAFISFYALNLLILTLPQHCTKNEVFH